ncbi:MAG: sulfur carrier protein ThiS adenylyltransferase ThiF [Lachnospirales bacterium]
MTKEDFINALIERHGEEVYKKLINSKIAIAGLGGLGSNVAMALARAGVGEIFIVDFDDVDISNLNRQQYFIEDIGKAKTEALSNLIRKANPVIKIKSKKIMVNEDNAVEIFKSYNIVCECFDKAENKAMLINTLLSEKSDQIVVSATGMAGYSSANTITTKKINDRFYLCGDGVNGVEDGLCLFSSRVGVCANHQANMALRLLLGIKEI